MAWKTVKKRWKWRSFLEAGEIEFIKEADAVAADIKKQQAAFAKKYGTKRAKIVNRAVQRAKFAALKKA